DELKRMPQEDKPVLSLDDNEATVKFVLIKEKEKTWKVLGGETRLSYSGAIFEGDILHLEFKGPNIFTNGVYSIRPEMYVTRNEHEFIKNGEFIYKTEIVRSADWTTPLLRYNYPIKTDGNNALQSIINDIPEQSLPFKTTAKFILGIGNVDDNLPYIPVKQMEYNGVKPIDIDAEFKD